MINLFEVRCFEKRHDNRPAWSTGFDRLREARSYALRQIECVEYVTIEYASEFGPITELTNLPGEPITEIHN